MTRAFLGLGSNLGDRWQHLRDAVTSLQSAGLIAVSPVYETEPMGGPSGQDRYLNLVVELDTVLTARQLLAIGRRLEAAAGRVRTERWGPRPLDVDILWVGGEPVNDPDLQVPHPRDVGAPLRRGAARRPGARSRAGGPRGAQRGSCRAGRAVERDLTMPAVRVIGPGRAGTALMTALEGAGWTIRPPVHRGESVADAATDVDLLILAVPDGSIAEVAAEVTPVDTTVVAHLAGSLGLDVLAPHPRRAGVHPLVALPNAEVGARRLTAARGSRWPVILCVQRVVEDLGGRWFTVADEDRAAYHAAAVIASNHLVALLGQAERVAEQAGVPFEAYLDLVRATVDNVAELGPAGALTGPAARGDDATIQRHLDALPEDEREAYETLVRLARRLVD